ncbi:MYND-type domain-containing protein [Mycena chlorophos]|uniref:MYND-type domain-containing protein n=1 Tax=Mycena chlorophos TaxID=658473 RepID=A0A8H6TIV7_MYCCL|nr:MYND-type domain-containing protein [Mycena chlorophos]
MHPSLKLSLSQLPVSIRKPAQAAYQGSGPALEFLQDHIESYSTNTRRHLLPVFYAQLALPAEELSEMEFVPLRMTVQRISHALACTSVLLHTPDAISPGALPELWPRIWDCIDVLNTISDLLVNETPYRLLLDLVTSVLHASRGAESMLDVVGRNLGVWRMMGRAWADWAKTREPEDDVTLGIAVLTHVFAGNEEDIPGEEETTSELKALMEGAEVGHDGFARLLILTLRWAIPTPETKVETDAALRVACVMRFLVRKFHDADNALRPAALKSGVIAPLTVCARAISASPPPDTAFDAVAFYIEEVLGLLIGFLSLPPSDQHRADAQFVQSLQQGLLAALLAYKSDDPNDGLRTGEYIGDFVFSVIPRFAVYYSVIAPLSAAFEQVKGLEMGRPELKSSWESLAETVAERKARVAAHNEQLLAGSMTRACGNPEVQVLSYNGEALPEALFWLLGDALLQLQMPEGALAGLSTPLADLFFKLRPENTQTLGAKNLSFFRTLIHADYLANREQIAFDLLSLLYDQRVADPVRGWDWKESIPCTVFDYSGSKCRISVDPQSDVAGGQEIRWDLAQEELQEFRESVSRGRMHLHLFVLKHEQAWDSWDDIPDSDSSSIPDSSQSGSNEGSESDVTSESDSNIIPATVLVFPLYVNEAGADMYRAIGRLAQEATPPGPTDDELDLEVYRPKIRELLAVEGVVETH